MINANELRIGNLVIINNSECYSGLKGIPFKIIGINKLKEYSIHLCNEVYNDYYQFINFIDPIFINEDYIYDLGFNWLCEDKFYIDNFYIEYIGSDTYKVYIDSTFIKEIKYVHELQNLFYIIKNKELKINI